MHLVAFDPIISGHHGEYLRFLAQAWHTSDLPGRLTLVTSPRFAELYPHVAALASDRFAIAEIEGDAYLQPPDQSRRALVRQVFRQWERLNETAADLRADHVLSMHVDQFLQGPLAAGARAACRVSGIYFRPTFHYPDLGIPLTAIERARALRQRLTCARAFRHRDLAYVFSLDPFAVPHMTWRRSEAVAVALPEPVDADGVAPGSAARVRAGLGVAPETTLFLLFGSLGPRKGLAQVLAAVGLLPPDIARESAVALVGKVAGDGARLAVEVDEIRRATGATLIVRDEYVADAEVPAYFAAADVVLAPYQRHTGSSGVLALAAAGGRPVLTSDFGYVGEVTRRYGLGLAVDTESPAAIAAAMSAFVADGPRSLTDEQAMADFAATNGAAAFGDTLLGHICGVSPT